MLALISHSCPWSKLGTMRQVSQFGSMSVDMLIKAQNLEIFARLPLAPPALYSKLIEWEVLWQTSSCKEESGLNNILLRGSMKWWWATKLLATTLHGSWPFELSCGWWWRQKSKKKRPTGPKRISSTDNMVVSCDFICNCYNELVVKSHFEVNMETLIHFKT